MDFFFFNLHIHHSFNKHLLDVCYERDTAVSKMSISHLHGIAFLVQGDKTNV